jgi:hypothetical protein
LFKYIHQNIQQAIDSGKPPSAIFITGDIANSGIKSEYDIFLDEFFWPLQDLISKTPCSDRIFLVPGNHDVDWSQSRAVRTHGLLTHIPTLLDPTVDAQFDRLPLIPRFKSFIDSDPTDESTNSHWISSPVGSLTRKVLFGSKKIGVICLNSAWLSCKADDRHNLSPGKGILEKSFSELEDAELVFVLAHHPIDWFLDDEVDSIRSLLIKHPSLYLFGHLQNLKGSRLHFPLFQSFPQDRQRKSPTSFKEAGLV